MVVCERDHRLTVGSLDDYLPCNFEELQNLLQCIPAPSHSWQEAGFPADMPAMSTFGSGHSILRNVAALWPLQFTRIQAESHLRDGHPKRDGCHRCA